MPSKGMTLRNLTSKDLLRDLFDHLRRRHGGHTGRRRGLQTSASSMMSSAGPAVVAYHVPAMWRPKAGISCLSRGPALAAPSSVAVLCACTASRTCFAPSSPAQRSDPAVGTQRSRGFRCKPKSRTTHQKPRRARARADAPDHPPDRSSRRFPLRCGSSRPCILSA